jgi:uncharacterized protein
MKKQNAPSLILGTLVGAIVLFLLASCGEEQFNPELTRKFAIHSTSTGASYSIKVALPENYAASGEKFSTVYVLDGEQDFDFVATTCGNLSKEHSLSNVIVVGIGYGRDRSIDYTPTNTGANTGGAPQFLAFIESELIPKIEQDFNAEVTRQSRAILGHSYGGLFGAYAFAVNNDLFGNYILLSPSLWFDNEVSMLLEKQHRAGNMNTHQLVFMGIGEAENSGRMQAPFEAFHQILRDNYSDIILLKNREDDLDHTGSKTPNIVEGLTHYFRNK